MSERRILTIVPTSATVVANMIGTGIFTTTGLMISMGAGPGDILLGWFIGGIVAFCGALCYGELGANMPHSGGEYFYLSRLHPALGFITGWLTVIVGFGAPIAAVAMALNLYLGTVIAGWPVRVATALTIIAVAWLHSHDLRMGSQIQSILTILKIILILVFIAGVFFSARLATPANTFTVNPNFLLSSAFAVVLVFVSFAYSGWNAAAYIAAELKNPERTLPWASLLGTGSVAALYVSLNVAYLVVVPSSELSGVPEIGNTVATRLWGPTGGNIVSLLISVTLLCPLSAMILVGPRVAEAMGKDGLLPPAFAKLNDRNVPSNAVMFLAAISVIIAMTSSFERLLIYIGFTLNIFAALSVIVLMRMRSKGQSKHKTCVGYPIPPIVFLIFTTWMTVWSIQSQPVATMAALATMVAAFVAYMVRMKKRELIQVR